MDKDLGEMRQAALKNVEEDQEEKATTSWDATAKEISMDPAIVTVVSDILDGQCCFASISTGFGKISVSAPDVPQQHIELVHLGSRGGPPNHCPGFASFSRVFLWAPYHMDTCGVSRGLRKGSIRFARSGSSPPQPI